MNPVTTISRRRFLRTYKHVAFALQLFCCIATTATFVRILHQHQLPLVFLVLPFLLFVTLTLDRCLPFHDRYIISIFTGATTGFISGFISSVVVNSSDALVDSAMQHRFVPIVCMLEFLHLPVVCGVVMYSFCLVFSRPPPLTIIILSFAVATCGMVIFNVASMILYEPETTSDEIGVGRSASVLVFLVIFFLALLPVVRTSRRAWIICASGFAASVYWQTGFFDTVQWNWEASSFPIPGFLTGLVTLFMLDVADLREAEDKLPLRRANEQHQNDDSEAVPTSLSGDTNNVSTALTWHSFSYVVERTSLTFIMESKGHRNLKSGTDTWISCLAMLGVLAILTSERRFSLTVRIIIVILGLVLYVSMTVVNGHLSNGYFLDDVFGLAFLATAATSDHIMT